MWANVWKDETNKQHVMLGEWRISSFMNDKQINWHFKSMSEMSNVMWANGAKHQEWRVVIQVQRKASAIDDDSGYSCKINLKQLLYQILLFLRYDQILFWVNIFLSPIPPNLVLWKSVRFDSEAINKCYN